VIELEVAPLLAPARALVYERAAPEQRPPSRSETFRRIGAGMWRDGVFCASTPDFCRGFRPSANRSFFTWSIFTRPRRRWIETQGKRFCRWWCGRPLRDLPDCRCNRGLRRQPSDLLFDLALRLACRLGEKLAVILGSQVLCEQPRSRKSFRSSTSPR
jgi:hypothetical protein